MTRETCDIDLPAQTPSIADRDRDRDFSSVRSFSLECLPIL